MSKLGERLIRSLTEVRDVVARGEHVGLHFKTTVYWRCQLHDRPVREGERCPDCKAITDSAKEPA